MRRCEKQKGVESKKGCVRPNLIEMEPKDCVVDLFLRITDILFNNVFARLHTLDMKSKLHGTTTDDHIRRATDKIRKIGISFSVWFSQDGNGKQSRSGLEITPLNRNENMKVVKNLSEFVDELLKADEQSAKLIMDCKLAAVKRILHYITVFLLCRISNHLFTTVSN